MARIPEALGERLAVVVGGEAGARELVVAAAHLARRLGVPWEALHVETADDPHAESAAAADALALAAKRGGTVVTVAAATLVDGVVEHLRASPATHLVIAQERRRGWGPWRPKSLADAILGRTSGVVLHIVPAEAAAEPAMTPMPGASARVHPLRNYGFAALAVLATLLVAEALQLVATTRSLDLIFLFPVIAVAARLGLRPALLAAALSVFSYNYFLLAPAFSFDAWAPQNWVMSAVFFAAAAYTSIVTTRMRGRLLLSDRSARENSGLAALAQRLTRDSDWEATAATLCEHVHGLFDLQTVMFREVGGELTIAAALPPDAELGPVDRAALDWSWAHGDEAGAGTDTMSAADWQFQPLKTSLGTLAVLGIAREDGRDPVRADRRVLLSTIVAQAALAHERLRLEDGMRAAPPPAGFDQP